MKYTHEQTKELLALYDNGNGKDVAEIAEIFAVPERSVIAKLASLGVYKRKSYTDKQGNLPVKKEEYVDRIAALLGKDVELLESLAKVNKNVLKWIEDALLLAGDKTND